MTRGVGSGGWGGREEGTKVPSWMEVGTRKGPTTEGFRGPDQGKRSRGRLGAAPLSFDDLGNIRLPSSNEPLHIVFLVFPSE